MLEYEDHRKFPRMSLECPARFVVEGGSGLTGAVVKDLSAGGVLLWISSEVAPGSTLRIEIQAPNTITPSLHADVKVLRCTPIEDGDGSFAAACEITEIIS